MLETRREEEKVKLRGKHVAVLVGPGYEDLEFWVPLMRLQEEGAEVTVVGIKGGDEYTSKSGGLTAVAEVGADEVSAEQFDGVVVPGGWAPDKIRRYEGVKTLVREVYDQDKIVASICHGGLVLISAGIMEGHKSTGSTGIKDDLLNAGAVWVDESAFREDNLVWGRVVADIPNFCRELVAALAE